MSTYTRRRRIPPEQYNIVGKRHGNVFTQVQHGVVPGRRAEGEELPFPNKPVSHRRPLKPRTEGSADLYDFEKITITDQQRGPLSLQECHSNGIRQTIASLHPREDSHRLPTGEIQLAKAIHAKKLVIQEKLWIVEEKIRQKIQRDSVDAALSNDLKNDDKKLDRRQAERGKAQTKACLSEQQRTEPARGREMMMQEKRQKDVKQRQDQTKQDGMRNTHEEARWTRREIEVAQGPYLHRRGRKETHEITYHGHEVSEAVNKSRWENVKKHTRGKRGDEKDDGIWGEKGVKSQDGRKKAEEREQNTTSMSNKHWTRGNKYGERTCKVMYNSDEEQDLAKVSQRETSHTAATENHRGLGRELSREWLLPPVSSPSHSGTPEQWEIRLIHSTYNSLQLLPCHICNRKFASERLEKHIQICKKVKQSNRQVFNSYVNRTKGSAIEEFWKTHSRSKTPEKKNLRLNHKAPTRNLHEGKPRAGTSQPKRHK